MNSPKVIEVDGLCVTVSPANGIMGMRRHRVRYEQSRIEDNDPDSRLLRLTTYPDMIACADIQPDFATFAAMPDVFLAQWEAACYELNPHWLDVGAGEKKATT
jgi:hypothetical protein